MSQNNGFTNNADLYRTSQAHSENEDLEQSLEVLPPIPGLEVLDVATGTGHTAFFFAKRQAHTFGVDINDEMLRVAQEESDSKTLSVRFLKCPVEDLMFDDEKFDLVTCRLAAHHFADPALFLRESRRVLRSSGHLLLIDNVVPNEAPDAQWLNDYERKRDPSHQRCLTVSEWTAKFAESGFEIVSSKRFPKKLLFDPWMERMSKSENERNELWEELLEAPSGAKDFVKPKLDSKKNRTLRLQRQIIVGRKK